MVVNDNAGYLDASGVWTTIASVLAPTGSAKLPQWQSLNHSYHVVMKCWHCDTKPHSVFLLIGIDQAK